MKTLHLFTFVFCAITACTDDTTAVKDFIPGTYVAKYHDSLSPTANVDGVDRLQISKQTEAGSETYEIVRINTFTRTMDNQVQPQKTQTETWVGLYDENSKTLATRNGKTLAFDLKNNVLFVGSKEYQKAK